MLRPLLRSSFATLALLALTLTAAAQTYLADTFDTKTVGTSIDGQSVETSSFAISQWDIAGDTDTTWTIDSAVHESSPHSLKATATGSDFSRAAPLWGVNEMPLEASYVARVSIFATGTGTISPGTSLISLSGDDLGFVTLAPSGAIFALHGPDGADLATADFASGADATYIANAWNVIEQRVETTATTQTTTYFVNGQQLYVGGAPMTITRNAGSFVRLQAFQLMAQSLTLGPNSNGVAYFDNVSLTNSAVPEPATFAALGVGALALLRRRKKSA